MQVTAKLNNLRIAPRKVRLIADMIRRKNALEAQSVLKFLSNKPSLPMLKLLNSAIANATSNFQLDPKNLYIAKITVDEGRKLKRWMPRARGRAAEIQKKTSFITLILEEIKPTAGKKKKTSKKVDSKPEQAKSEEVKYEEVKSEEKVDFKPKMRQDISQKPKSIAGLQRIFRRKSI